MRRLSLAAALLIAGTGTAQAQTDKPAVAAPAPADPARLAAAERVVARLVPAGIYKELFDKVYSQLVEQALGQAGELPLAQLARLGGISKEEAQALGNTKLREIIEIYDPVWKERQRRTMKAFSGAMVEIMAKMEPPIRAAMARAYAREFTAEELADLDRYFATPTGAHYAARSIAISAGPDMMEAMNAMMPAMMEAMPGIVEKAQAATADLPPERKNDDLSPAERRKLAELFGVDPETLEDDAS